MTHSPTHRFLLAIGQIMLITATSLSVPLWPAHPANATIAAPGSLSSTNAPAGLVINSPWISDASGTEWAYGTSSLSMGTLISRNRTTGEFTSRAISAGDEGSIAGFYSPTSNAAVFSVRRAGAGNRIITFDLTTGTRLATRTLAADENLIRALTFTSTGDSYTIGTNQNPAKVMKFTTTTGALEYSSTLGTGLKEITAFIPSGYEFLAAVNTNPIKLVAVTRNRLVVGTVYSLAAGTPPLMDPIVVGNTAYLGTDATPGRITAIDIPTRTVVGSATLNTGEVGARNLVVDESTGTLYATTNSESGPRIASFRLTDLSRLGTTQLSPGNSVTSLLFFGRTLAAGFEGTRGVETFTVAPEPNAPTITGVQNAASSLVVSWTSGGSVEPILDYTASASAAGSSQSCSSSGTTCTIRGLTNGTTYAITVVARSVAGTSSDAVSSGTPRSVPDAPSISRVTRGNTNVTVNWTPNGDGGSAITGYRATALPSGQMCESIAQTCTISGLVNGIPQTIQVVARNAVGTSQPSAPSTAVTPATTPQAPQINSATRLNSAAVIAWDPPANNGGDDIASYLVRVTQGSNIVSEATTTERSLTIDGLTNGVIYGIVVLATNTAGNSGPSAHAFVTPATVPDAPLAITALRQNSGTDVSWDVPTNNGGDPITHYRIQVQTGNDPATSFTATESPYSIRGLDNGKTYAVTVSAINSVGESVASDPVEVTPATVPDAPLAITALRQNAGADVSWDMPSNNGGDPITHYRVTVRSGSERATSFVTVESPFSIRGLDNGTTYAVTVSALNSVGESIESESVLVTPATVPDAPLAITALRQNAGAEVSWTVPSNDGGDPINHFRIQVQNGNDPATNFTATESPFFIRGLENGKTYAVSVSAINSVGESVASDPVEVTPATVPDPPTWLRAVPGDSGASLEWSPPDNDGGDPVTLYRVRVWNEAAVVAEFETTAPSSSVTGLANGVDYRITVTSINSVGEGIMSEPAMVTPVSPPVVDPPIVDPPVVDPPPAVRPPSPPVAVTVISASRKSITVGWRIDDSGGVPVNDFVVHTSRYKNRGFTVWPDGTSTIQRIELRKPRRGALYVRVIAVNSGGESAPSQVKRVAR